MNVNIEKIDNGFIVTIGSKKTFCSTPETVCGLMAEWVLKTCETLETKVDDTAAKLKTALAQIAGQEGLMPNLHDELLRPWLSPEDMVKFNRPQPLATLQGPGKKPFDVVKPHDKNDSEGSE